MIDQDVGEALLAMQSVIELATQDYKQSMDGISIIQSVDSTSVSDGLEAMTHALNLALRTHDDTFSRDVRYIKDVVSRYDSEKRYAAAVVVREKVRRKWNKVAMSIQRCCNSQLDALKHSRDDLTQVGSLAFLIML